jgi:uncharacterized protein YcfJ
MKKLLLTGLLFTGLAQAAPPYSPPPEFVGREEAFQRGDYARVVKIEPNYVTVQQQVCQQGQVVRDNSGVDSAIGGVAGAVIGNGIAGRHNKALGTIVGGVAGAVIGNDIGKDSQRVEPVTTCHMEQQTVQQGQIVTFEYRNVRFTRLFGQ